MSRSILQRRGTVSVVAHAQGVIKMESYGIVCFTQKLEWTVLPHTHTHHTAHILPPNFPTSSRALKDAIRGKMFGSDNKVIEEVTENIKFKLVQEGVDVLVSRWSKAILS